MSGIQAIQSLTSHLWPSPASTQPPASCHLPYLFALYDYLNDDDDEIRAAAASAAAPLLGRPLVSMEAGARLLGWLGQSFSDQASSDNNSVSALPHLQAHVASRLVGQQQEKSHQGWVAAADQLTDAMRFDDSLFVIEEQNLYVDEVREALRWRGVLLSLPRPAGDDAVLAALAEWTADGLATLVRLASPGAAAGGDDGVLGWLSKPEVFAIAARVVISGAALSSLSSPQVKSAQLDRVRNEMARFVEVSTQTRVHGLLMDMCHASPQ